MSKLILTRGRRRACSEIRLSTGRPQRRPMVSMIASVLGSIQHATSLPKLIRSNFKLDTLSHHQDSFALLILQSQSLTSRKEGLYRMADRPLWPRLTYPAPNDTTEHLNVLLSDFNTIHVYLNERSKDLKIPQNIFDHFHQSYKELKTEIEAKLNSSCKKGGNRRRVTQDSSDLLGSENVIPQGTPIIMSTPGKTDLHEENSRDLDSSESKSSFTIKLKNIRVVSLIRGITPKDLRSLVCRACNKDPDSPTAPGDRYWISSFNQTASGKLLVFCFSKEERDMLNKHKEWKRQFEEFVSSVFSKQPSATTSSPISTADAPLEKIIEPQGATLSKRLHDLARSKQINKSDSSNVKKPSTEGSSSQLVEDLPTTVEFARSSSKKQKQSTTCNPAQRDNPNPSLGQNVTSRTKPTPPPSQKPDQSRKRKAVESAPIPKVKEDVHQGKRVRSSSSPAVDKRQTRASTSPQSLISPKAPLMGFHEIPRKVQQQTQPSLPP